MNNGVLQPTHTYKCLAVVLFPIELKRSEVFLTEGESGIPSTLFAFLCRSSELSPVSDPEAMLGA